MATIYTGFNLLPAQVTIVKLIIRKISLQTHSMPTACKPSQHADHPRMIIMPAHAVQQPKETPYFMLMCISIIASTAMILSVDMVYYQRSQITSHKDNFQRPMQRNLVTGPGFQSWLDVIPENSANKPSVDPFGSLSEYEFVCLPLSHPEADALLNSVGLCVGVQYKICGLRKISP